MKYFKLFFLFIFAFSLTSLKTNDYQYYVQFKIDAKLNKQAANQINLSINQKEGIEMIRTDINSSTALILLKEGVSYSENQFVIWFNELGYSISCFHNRIYKKEKLISPSILKNCNE